MKLTPEQFQVLEDWVNATAVSVVASMAVVSGYTEKTADSANTQRDIAYALLVEGGEE